MPDPITPRDWLRALRDLDPGIAIPLIIATVITVGVVRICFGF